MPSGFALAVAGSLLLLPPAAFAGDAPADRPGSADVGELLERIERLEQNNQRMQGTIDELRTQVGEDWLTEQRADEVRALVSDVLADADTRAGFLQDGITAGWDGNFFLSSADGRFLLNIGGLLQTRFIWNYHDQPDRYVWGFENTRTKLVLRGHVFSPAFQYLIRSNFSRSDTLLTSPVAASPGNDLLEDAWIQYDLNDEWSFRMGQFKEPFNREELVLPEYQQAIERSLVNESFNLGRTQGIELTYLGDTMKLQIVPLSDGGTDNIGAFNTIKPINEQPQNSPWNNSDVEYAVTARFENLVAGGWEQFQQMTSPPGDPFALMWGAAFHVEQTESDGLPTVLSDESFWFAATADLSIQLGGANFFTSVTYDYVDTASFGVGNLWGMVLQGGVYFTEKLEAYGRLEVGDGNIGTFDFDTLIVLTIGTNYYIDGQDLKISADVGFGIDRIDALWDSSIAGYRFEGDGAQPQIVIRTQLQLMF